MHLEEFVRQMEALELDEMAQTIIHSFSAKIPSIRGKDNRDLAAFFLEQTELVDLCSPKTLNGVLQYLMLVEEMNAHT